jgi:hypothetical protein
MLVGEARDRHASALPDDTQAGWTFQPPSRLIELRRKSNVNSTRPLMIISKVEYYVISDLYLLDLELSRQGIAMKEKLPRVAIDKPVPVA